MNLRIVTVLFLLTLSLLPFTARADQGTHSVSTFRPDQPLVLPIDKSAATACQLFRHNPDDTVLGYNSGYETGERTVVYFDPAECEASPYPFELQSLEFTLFDPPSFIDNRTYHWPLQLDLVVYGLTGGDSCNGPGAELCRVPLVCDSATFAFPNVGTAVFPTACCVDGPFFIGLEYTDTATGPYPSIMYDYHSTPGLCQIFMYTQNTWLGWYAYWVTPPGYPFYWVNGETVSLACCDDLDNDLVCDFMDNCPGIANTDQADADGDGVGDLCDNCPFTYNPGQEDTDLDGIADACDNCPSVANAGQTDIDMDGIGDACDLCPNDPTNDVDGDGVCGLVDNCPTTFNPAQTDTDLDGTGDACEVLDMCSGIRGNVDGLLDDQINVSDLTFLVAYLFQGGPPPPVFAEADVNADGSINVADLTYLVAFLFAGGPAPLPC